MKKQRLSALALLAALFLGLTAGFFWGRNTGGDALRVNVARSAQTVPTETTEAAAEETTQPVVFPIDLNAASERELLALPGVGEVLAERILAYRQEHGPFEHVEELLNVEGIGQKRLEAIWDLVSVG